MKTARVRAQAKVNLWLRVLAKEASGYHQIETLFCRLELADLVTLRLTSGERALRCHGDVIPTEGLGPNEDNLAWKAAEAFARATSYGGGFDIEIEKHIPVGGGLGGGSADAGAVLRLLNALTDTPLPHDALLDVAASLGADVPFLTQEESPLALGWGRGDRLLALPALPPRPCLVVSAPFGVSTAAAYRWIDEAGHRSITASRLGLAQLLSWNDIARYAHNDFEGPVTTRLPALGIALNALNAARQNDSQLIAMSGTGSTLYGVGLDQTPPLPGGFTAQVSSTASTVASIHTVA